MKKKWEEPSIMVQKFMPNEYVAACYTLVCAIPGESPDRISDGTATRWFREKESPWDDSVGSRFWDGEYIKADRLAHGNCGNESTSYNVEKGIGYETNNDGTVKNAVITNVHIGSPSGGSIYYANWQSNNGTLYTHYGFAIKDSNENHS